MKILRFCSLITWTILEMEMDVDFKKMSTGRQGGTLPPYVAEPMPHHIPPQP